MKYIFILIVCISFVCAAHKDYEIFDYCPLDPIPSSLGTMLKCSLTCSADHPNAECDKSVSGNNCEDIDDKETACISTSSNSACKNIAPIKSKFDADYKTGKPTYPWKTAADCTIVYDNLVECSQACR